jgi:hypothetical protein
VGRSQRRVLHAQLPDHDRGGVLAPDVHADVSCSVTAADGEQIDVRVDAHYRRDMIAPFLRVALAAQTDLERDRRPVDVAAGALVKDRLDERRVSHDHGLVVQGAEIADDLEDLVKVGPRRHDCEGVLALRGDFPESLGHLLAACPRAERERDEHESRLCVHPVELHEG